MVKLCVYFQQVRWIFQLNQTFDRNQGAEQAAGSQQRLLHLYLILVVCSLFHDVIFVPMIVHTVWIMYMYWLLLILTFEACRLVLLRLWYCFWWSLNHDLPALWCHAIGLLHLTWSDLHWNYLIFKDCWSKLLTLAMRNLQIWFPVSCTDN